MRRKDFGPLLVLMVLSGFVGAAFNSWLTGAAQAYAQPVPYEDVQPRRYERDSAPLDGSLLKERLQESQEAFRNRDEATRARRAAPEQQLAIPGGVVTARAFHFTDGDGRTHGILTTRQGPKGPQIVLMNAEGQTIWTAPDGVGVRFAD